MTARAVDVHLGETLIDEAHPWASRTDRLGAPARAAAMVAVSLRRGPRASPTPTNPTPPRPTFA